MEIEWKEGRKEGKGEKKERIIQREELRKTQRDQPTIPFHARSIAQ